MVLVTKALTIEDLPSAEVKEVGWPWTEASDPLPDHMSDGSEWPRISIVTPSYNQGQFIEETIRSVLLQGYPNLEYIIIDGGSADNTVEIIKKYDPWIAYWVSERDNGQSHGLNKGFAKISGELVGWQNSDDYYRSNAFINVINHYMEFTQYDVFYGLTNNVDVNSKFIRSYPVTEFDICNLLPYPNICNQSIFFKKNIFQDGNFIDESFCHAMDLEFFVRLGTNNYSFYFIQEILGYYRLHENSKGSTMNSICIEECYQIYKSIYLNKNSPKKLNDKALRSIYNLCIHCFAERRLSEFRLKVQQLFTLSGFKVIDFHLVFKYIISLIVFKNSSRQIRKHNKSTDRLR